jgi:hypothetical protein
MPSAKTGDRAMGEYLQHVLREWLAADSSRTEAEFAALAGLSRGQVNNIKNKAEGAGAVTVQKFALALGVSRLQLHADQERWEAARSGRAPVVELDQGVRGVRFGDLPGWAEQEAEARRAYPDIPGYAFDRAANTSGGQPPRQITAAAIAELAGWWLRNAPREERRQAEREEVLRQIGEQRARAVRKETPAPPSAKPLRPKL